MKNDFIKCEIIAEDVLTWKINTLLCYRKRLVLPYEIQLQSEWRVNLTVHSVVYLKPAEYSQKFNDLFTDRQNQQKLVHTHYNNNDFCHWLLLDPFQRWYFTGKP